MTGTTPLAKRSRRRSRRAELAGLGDGVHSIYLYAQDSIGAGNWSQFATSIEFTIDKGLPTVVDATMTPSPNNGTLAYNGSQVFQPVVRLEATITDDEFVIPVTDPPSSPTSRPGSPIVAAEFTFGTAAETAGTGEPMQSATATWGDTVDGNVVQQVYADIPLADLRSMPEGVITFWVRGLDAAGNWSEAISVDFVHDTTAPVVVLDATTSPGSVLVSVTDPINVPKVGNTLPTTHSNIVAVEWFVAGNDPGEGLATQVVLPDPLAMSYSGLVIGPLAPGTDIQVRALDAAGNWSLLQNAGV